MCGSMQKEPGVALSRLLQPMGENYAELGKMRMLKMISPTGWVTENRWVEGHPQQHPLTYQGSQDDLYQYHQPTMLINNTNRGIHSRVQGGSVEDDFWP